MSAAPAGPSRTASWLCCLGLLACEPGLAAPARPAEPPRPAPVRAVAGEAFDLGPARGCRVRTAEPYFAEWRQGDEGSSPVPGDVLVLRVVLQCEAHPAALDEVRPTWVPDTGTAVPPTEGTTAPAPGPPLRQWVFAVPGELPRAGEPLGELRLRSEYADVDVVLPKRPAARASEPGSPASRQACERRTRRLRETLRSEYAHAPPEGPECNVLGFLVPRSCPDAMQDAHLIERVTGVARDCGTPALRTLFAGERSPVPEDFQLTLRRDRCAGHLDRCPRYTVVLYANRTVVFHGQHRVNTRGRHDGRTDPRLLAALWHQVQEMSLLTRRGRFARDPRCAARGSERGNLLRVQAGGHHRMVVDREGCRGPFSSGDLEALARHVDAAAQVALWTGGRPAYADRSVRQWTVRLD